MGKHSVNCTALYFRKCKDDSTCSEKTLRSPSKEEDAELDDKTLEEEEDSGGGNNSGTVHDSRLLHHYDRFNGCVRCTCSLYFSHVSSISEFHVIT